MDKNFPVRFYNSDGDILGNTGVVSLAEALDLSKKIPGTVVMDDEGHFYKAARAWVDIGVYPHLAVSCDAIGDGMDLLDEGSEGDA